MSKTRAQIQFKVISILVGGNVGFAPSDEDATTIDGYIDDEVEEINSEAFTYISDPDDLEDKLFVTFCKLVANAAAEEFGATSDEGKADKLRNRIRKLCAETPGYGPQEVSFF